MKRKKLLFYTMIMQKGGAEQTLANLVNHFIKEYDITLVTNIKFPSEYELNPKIKFINIDKENKKDEKSCNKIFTKLSKERSKLLKEIIIKEKPNIMISFLPEPTIRALSLKKYFKCLPIIVAVRNHPQKEFNYPFLKFIRNFYYKKADQIILQDESYVKYLSKNIKNKITIIPNFLSSDFILENEVKTRKKKIVTVTRLEKQKNVSLLIEAFSKLNSKFNDYKLYIYGTGSEKSNLESQIKKLSLEERVFLLGRAKSIKEVIIDASLFVLPSNYEGMPNVLLEAMSLSLPVISTRSTEVIDKIIDNGKNGIVVDKNDVRMLTNKIEYILENDFIAKKIGKEASKVKEKYNKKNIIDTWSDVFKKYL
jgi:glycosyltransferase involved in cell wall biosynthesis